MTTFTSDYVLTMKDIVQEGADILRTKIDEVSIPIDEETKVELECMMQYLKNSQDEEMAKKLGLRPGIGLSGNQVGLNKRMFVTYFQGEKGESYEHKFINPKILSHSTHVIFIPQGEGCLSVEREVLGHVPRYDKIKFEACNELGEKSVYTFRGFPAIVMQHEMDHLNGVMFFDRINKDTPFLNMKEDK